MESVLVRERYKIARVLEAADGYAFAEAVDIADRETSVRLLNIYEGEWLPVYARIFADMNVCPAFCEAFLSGDSLTAVFQSSRGVAIDRVFYRGGGLVLARQDDVCGTVAASGAGTGGSARRRSAARRCCRTMCG